MEKKQEKLTTPKMLLVVSNIGPLWA